MLYPSIKDYLGNQKQVFRIDDYRFHGGYADNMRMFHVHNAAEMEFACSVDRCMDIHYLRCNGHNLGFLTCAGDKAPQYYDDRGLGWLKSFTAGFMTTCGLRNIGIPEEYQGQALGLHGRVSNIPAEEASASTLETEHGPAAQLRGVMRDSQPTGANMVLTRSIQTSYAAREIHICDKVKNCGFLKSLHMILYHFNLGYPLLTEKTHLLIPSQKATPRNRDAAAAQEAWKTAQVPAVGLPERCYYHDIKADNSGKAFVAAFNPELNVGVAIHYNKNVLDHFVQWHQMTSGYYAIGLEPCNATIDGVADAIANGSAKWLEPEEGITYNLTIELLADVSGFQRLERMVYAM